MARRARSSFQPAWLVAGFFLCLLVGGGGFWVYSQVSDPFRTLAVFPATEYLENSNSLRGNVYRVSGTVANQLGWSAETGRLYSLDLDEGKDVLPVLVPASFNSTNLQKGQRFIFEVEVDERGILLARRLQKS